NQGVRDSRIMKLLYVGISLPGTCTSMLSGHSSYSCCYATLMCLHFAHKSASPPARLRRGSGSGIYHFRCPLLHSNVVSNKKNHKGNKSLVPVPVEKKNEEEEEGGKVKCKVE
ncbi:hypothetical protein KI387_033321, partial [Taxus chinensis]